MPHSKPPICAELSIKLLDIVSITLIPIVVNKDFSSGILISFGNTSVNVNPSNIPNTPKIAPLAPAPTCMPLNQILTILILKIGSRGDIYKD